MQDYCDFKKGQLVKVIRDADMQLPTIMCYNFEKRILNYVDLENMENINLTGIIVEDYMDFSREYVDYDNSFDNFKAKIKNTLSSYVKYHDNSFKRSKDYLAEHFSWVYIDNGYYFISKENLKAI